MATDLRTFLEIYGKPSDGERIDRYGYEFRYCTAALLIACSHADQDEDPEEERVILEILQTTFDVSQSTLESMMRMARTFTEDDLPDIANLINTYYAESHKLLMLEHLWRVALADGHLHPAEAAFIDKVASLIGIEAEQNQQARRDAEATA